jgi:hypothetical protein
MMDACLRLRTGCKLVRLLARPPAGLVVFARSSTGRSVEYRELEHCLRLRAQACALDR